MVFTLHRYIFRELLKVFVLAVVALTLILSLGSILRPVQEYGVGPRQVIHLMGYFLPITLTFVLPMAALFAGTLVYGRFASDNELDACRASGISMVTLVYPGLALAIVVAIANLVLSFHVMPAFIHLAEKSLKADARKILFRNIQRRGYYKLPPDEQYLIYADHTIPDKGRLLGIVITEMKNYGIKKIITAERADINFRPHERFNEVQITAYNTYQIGPEETEGFSAKELSFTAEFGSLLGDDIKFKNIDEMKKIQADLMRFDPVAKLAREIYAQFTVELLAEDIESKITRTPKRDEMRLAAPEDANNFYKLHSGEKFVEFTASGVAPAERKVELSGEVMVVESDAATKQPLCTLRCARALLHIEGDELAPTLTMDIYNARVEGTGDLRMRHIIRGLIPPKAVSDKFKTGKILDDIDPELVSSALQKGPSQRLRGLQNRLKRRIQKTLVQIKAEMHSRLVFGIGCVSMILIGIGLGIIKKGGHLLSAFAASCVPATVLIVCIISGKQITENLGSQSASGIVLMWAGLVFLCLLAGGIYCKLLKN